MIEFMQRAITLGERGRITAPPNPWVGCVIVKGGRIIGEGYHQRAGEPHAEVIALRQAGSDAAGSTLFCTLEPCCHFGRTPPCTEALIAARVSHVVVAHSDPDPRVAGKGMEALKNAGIKISLVGEDLAKKSLEPYLHHRKTGLPFCVAKAAISIDGRTSATDHSSQWITSEAARRDAHLLRAESQAILIGAATARRDNPKLNVRNIAPLPATPPLRVVITTSGNLPFDGALFDPALGKTLIFTTTPISHAPCEVIEIANLKEVLQHLGKRGILQVMVEGGATLLGSFLKESLINRLVIYMGPCVLGEKGKPLFSGVEIPNIHSAPRLKLLDVKQWDDCVRMRYFLQN